MQGIPQGPQSQGGSQKPSLSWSSPGAAKPISAHEKPKPPAPQKTNPMNIAGNSNVTTYVGIFVAGLVVGGLLGWGVLAGRNPSTSQVADSTDNTSGAAAVDLSGSSVGVPGGISVSDQKAGSTVSVSNVTVDKPTWVGVYDDVNGVPGKALGVQLFFPTSVGGKTSGAIALIRNTVAGQTYLVGQRVDNGDHAYATASDAAVADPNGKQITVKFTAQ